ncbi:endo alpha-1,4 polygalactosaminidase [Trinickia sp. LjRoot230]|uniref:endo alpha-1,4 polygalactosaminidase n=1 Tax=Trinickia sp. LjRoot230 TaxID=3342288 RepID=UPI003ECECD9F
MTTSKITQRSKRWLAAFVSFASFGAAMMLPSARDARAEQRGSDAIPLNSVAFFYGETVPVERFAGFDVVVVEPDAAFDPNRYRSHGPQWFAYVSVGEVTPDRAYYQAIPKRWLTGRNADWDATIVDQSASRWPAFFVKHVIAPLWQRGYRGFFLDTLDSYQIVAKTDPERARQQAGIVAVIRAIKARYPGARLILNRGFEVLPRVHNMVSAVAFESLYGSWDQRNGRYGEVSVADRTWLLGQANVIRERYALPVISIDYCSPENTAYCGELARKISDAGLIPYVTDGALRTVGVGPAGVTR